MSPDKRDSDNPRRALGRGLGALIPTTTERRDFFQCPTDRILVSPHQPRKVPDPDELAGLADSIKTVGIIQPLVVRQDGSEYRLIAGERRLRAAKLAGVQQLPVVIKDVDADQAFELALIENIQREDLNPLEEAEAYRRLMESRGYTQTELADRLGKSRPAIANTLRLLGLHEGVQRTVSEGKLAEGAARALLSLPTPEHQLEVADATVGEALSVRQVESIVKRVKGGQTIDDAVQTEISGPVAEAPQEPQGPLRPAKKKPGRKKLRDDAQVRALREELQRSLGTRVAVNDRGGRGSIEIFFESYDALDSILHKLKP